jgi:uncharacterized C2H2 Zn-finger protein
VRYGIGWRGHGTWPEATLTRTRAFAEAGSVQEVIMEQFRCPVCQAEFSTNEQLQRHISQHEEQSRGVREPAPNTPDERRRDEDREGGHAGARSPADLACPRCGTEFHTREELDRHGRAQHLI